MPPTRIQRKRTKGFTLPEGTVCITRPGKYGNWFEGENAAELFAAHFTGPGALLAYLALHVSEIREAELVLRTALANEWKRLRILDSIPQLAKAKYLA